VITRDRKARITCAVAAPAAPSVRAHARPRARHPADPCVSLHPRTVLALPLWPMLRAGPPRRCTRRRRRPRRPAGAASPDPMHSRRRPRPRDARRDARRKWCMGRGLLTAVGRQGAHAGLRAGRRAAGQPRAAAAVAWRARGARRRAPPGGHGRRQKGLGGHGAHDHGGHARLGRQHRAPVHLDAQRSDDSARRREPTDRVLRWVPLACLSAGHCFRSL